MTEEEFAKKRDLEDVARRTGALESDMRMTAAEIIELKKDTNCLPQINITLALQGQTLNSMSKNINRLIWLFVAALISGVGAWIFSRIGG